MPHLKKNLVEIETLQIQLQIQLGCVATATGPCQIYSTSGYIIAYFCPTGEGRREKYFFLKTQGRIKDPCISLSEVILDLPVTPALRPLFRGSVPDCYEQEESGTSSGALPFSGGSLAPYVVLCHGDEPVWHPIHTTWKHWKQN